MRTIVPALWFPGLRSVFSSNHNIIPGFQLYDVAKTALPMSLRPVGWGEVGNDCNMSDSVVSHFRTWTPEFIF